MRDKKFSPYRVPCMFSRKGGVRDFRAITKVGEERACIFYINLGERPALQPAAELTVS